MDGLIGSKTCLGIGNGQGHISDDGPFVSFACVSVQPRGDINGEAGGPSFFAKLVDAVGLFSNATTEIPGCSDTEEPVDTDDSLTRGRVVLRFFIVLLQLDAGEVGNVVSSVREVKVRAPAPAFQPAGNDEGITAIVALTAENLSRGRGRAQASNLESTATPGFIHVGLGGNAGRKQ